MAERERNQWEHSREQKQPENTDQSRGYTWERSSICRFAVRQITSYTRYFCKMVPRFFIYSKMYTNMNIYHILFSLRYTFEFYLKVMDFFATQCNHLLRRRDITEFLKDENFDMLVTDYFNCSPFLIIEKLRKAFGSILAALFSL